MPPPRLLYRYIIRRCFSAMSNSELKLHTVSHVRLNNYILSRIAIKSCLKNMIYNSSTYKVPTWDSAIDYCKFDPGYSEIMRLATNWRSKCFVSKLWNSISTTIKRQQTVIVATVLTFLGYMKKDIAEFTSWWLACVSYSFLLIKRIPLQCIRK